LGKPVQADSLQRKGEIIRVVKRHDHHQHARSHHEQEGERHSSVIERFGRKGQGFTRRVHCKAPLDFLVSSTGRPEITPSMARSISEITAAKGQSNTWIACW